VSVLAAADGDQLPSLLAQIPMTLRLRLLAERFARLRRQNPDAAIVGAWDEARAVADGRARSGHLRWLAANSDSKGGWIARRIS
jgi:hypothetical protein